MQQCKSTTATGTKNTHLEFAYLPITYQPLMNTHKISCVQGPLTQHHYSVLLYTLLYSVLQWNQSDTAKHTHRRTNNHNVPTEVISMYVLQGLETPYKTCVQGSDVLALGIHLGGSSARLQLILATVEAVAIQCTQDLHECTLRQVLKPLLKIQVCPPLHIGPLATIHYVGPLGLSIICWASKQPLRQSMR